MKPLAAAAGAGLVVALTIACQRSSTAPTPTPTPTGTLTVIGLAIKGPERLAPGETAQFTAVATMSDHSTQDYTRKVSWNAGPPAVIRIARDSGEATAETPGDAFIDATLPSVSMSYAACCTARASALVLPPNTYRLTGKVLEAGLPLQGATVAVVSGIGSGPTATTDYDGQYRLSGVAGAVQIKVSKPGYVDLVKSFTASQNDVLDFPEARQTQAIPSVSGSYVAP